MENDEAVQAYYALAAEADRLSEGLGRVELARTIDVLERTLPTPPAVIADIGGGPGRYVDWLVELGYDVVHRDVVADHVDQVRSRHADRVDAAIGDARSLDLADDSVDAMLLLGPIYHLPDGAARQRVYAEAARVVRPGGLVLVAAISRWAARIHGLLIGRVHHVVPDALELIDELERTGDMPPLYEGSFCGFSHRPDDFVEEVSASPLELERILSVESVAVSMHDLDERMDDPDERLLLLGSLRALESVPELVGVGPHILAIARSPHERDQIST